MIFAASNNAKPWALYDAPAPDAGRGFHYYFPNSKEVSTSPRLRHRLSELERHLACYQTLTGNAGCTVSDPMRGFAQFVAQDITSMAPLGSARPKPGARKGAAMARRDVINSIQNHRSGAMDLEILYGGSIKNGRAGHKLTALLRHPSAKGKLMEVTTSRRGTGVPCDLAALQRLTRPGAVGQGVAHAPDATIRDLFFHADELVHVPPHRGPHGPHGHAGLKASDFHSFFQVLHNELVDRLSDADAPHVSSDALFHTAQQHMRWHFQWMVINLLLPQICHGETLEQVISDEAPLYRHLASAVPVDDHGQLPMPVEFSAAFRFVCGSAPTAALQKDFVLNLPSAQTCMMEVSQACDMSLPALSQAQLTSGETGLALIEAGLQQETPLGYYIQKEAEVLCGGKTLGPLGTVLVANTLLGMVIADPQSYWNQDLVGSGRWHPAAGSIQTIEMLEQALNAAPIGLRQAMCSKSAAAV